MPISFSFFIDDLEDCMQDRIDSSALAVRGNCVNDLYLFIFDAKDINISGYVDSAPSLFLLK